MSAPAAASGTATAATTTSTAGTTTTSTTPTPKSGGNSLEFNPHWKGYSYILLASFINLVALGDIDTEVHDLAHVGRWGISLSFGIVLFTFSLTVLVTDRLQLGIDVVNYAKAYNGRVEGTSLVLATFVSLVGVAYLTQVRGVAYLALNVYCSAWLLPVACIYTLNEWSTAHDILSVHELTGVSATLKSWYIVALASAVVTGTSLNMLVVLGNMDDTDVLDTARLLHRDNIRAAVFGMAFGCFSTVLAVWFILSHYNLVECCWITEGGWAEMVCILVIVPLWIVGTAVLTQYGGLAATIIGSGAEQVQRQWEEQQWQPPPEQPTPVVTLEQLLTQITEWTPFNESSTATTECQLIVHNVSYSCRDLWNVTHSNDTATASPVVAPVSRTTPVIPGSNLYMAVWICLLASLNLAFRWKAQQALQFAQAQHEKAFGAVGRDDESERPTRDDDGVDEMDPSDGYDD